MSRRKGERRGQLDLMGPPADGWWEVDYGAGRLWIIADDAAEAARRAEVELRDLGVTAGGPPGLHESYLRMREFARGGRR